MCGFSSFDNIKNSSKLKEGKVKGLELSKLYYEIYGKPMIEQRFSQYKEDIATGLVGEGSECFGFDDEYSKDHDFGPGFCIWLPRSLYMEIGESLQRAYNELPSNFMGYSSYEKLVQRRVGVFDIENFYNKYTNCGAFPKNIVEWMKIPERFLATAVNGEVFFDAKGDFSRAREILKSFYPDDVLKKKLASRLANMAQTGQYNYVRCARREDFAAAYLCFSEFVKLSVSAVFLLNREYMPFYKWAFRKARELKNLKEVIEKLEELISIPDNPDTYFIKFDNIEFICKLIARESCRSFNYSLEDNFLETHAKVLMSQIKDERIAALHIMADFD